MRGFVHKRTVHLPPSERIKGVRTLRQGVCVRISTFYHRFPLLLRRSLFSSFPFLAYFTFRSRIVCGHRVHRIVDSLRDGRCASRMGKVRANGTGFYAEAIRASPPDTHPGHRLLRLPIPLALPSSLLFQTSER